jgi:hypothetical protein
MNKEKVLTIMNDLIKLNNNVEKDEIWMSLDLFAELDIEEYKGYKLYTTVLLPNDYMIIGKMFYE